jgi:MoaA/NifB/PqqE/SkfB family radical SAM enzyme
MQLEDIGFYSMTNHRARTSSKDTRLERCELLLTKRCNFSCPYCRSVGPPDATWEEAAAIVAYWKRERCRNMRFSGGEPTLWKHLRALVCFARYQNPHLEHIALSTNGSAPIEQYDQLLAAGVNDFSISLDACCCATVGTMTGKNGDIVRHVMDVIRHLAPKTYVTLGTVVLPKNLLEVVKVVEFALEAGVSDVRLISAAQWNRPVYVELPPEALERFPIMRYRWENMKAGRHVRGMGEGDCRTCHLAKDDMAVSAGMHYPCIIHMREGGEPIGEVGPYARDAREDWAFEHDSYADPICRKNCLDVCIDYNNCASQGCTARHSTGCPGVGAHLPT